MEDVTKKTLLERAIEIKTETQIGANTADRVGSLFEDIIRFMGALTPAIASVQEFDPIEISTGVESGSISFPTEATASLDNDEEIILDIIWDIESSVPEYDKDVEGTYTFSGNLVVIPGIANPNNITGSIDVIVTEPM